MQVSLNFQVELSRLVFLERLQPTIRTEAQHPQIAQGLWAAQAVDLLESAW
jgi:hypothetical protein